ncbi:hypothetical protein ZWY2020_025486 [Hordeum vulgare]|nr:hypothetical protein ZWY2020_025486 [Hordeum vulgare]
MERECESEILPPPFQIRAATSLLRLPRRRAEDYNGPRPRRGQEGGTVRGPGHLHAHLHLEAPPGVRGQGRGAARQGVDTAACVSINEAFVMHAWKESLGVGAEVLLLSDHNDELTRAMGVELDLEYFQHNPVGLGLRSRRYALLADDGVVKVLNLEEGGA